MSAAPERPPTRPSEATMRRRAAAMRAATLRREFDAFARDGPSHDLRTPLLGACEDGAEDAARVILELGAAVDERDEKGTTALMTAAAWGHAGVCRLLLERGADANARDDGGDTALHEAVRADADEVVIALCEWPGCDVDAKNKHGCAPLHVASHAGNGAMTKLLIRLGACVNREMNGGYSALHVAAANGSSSSLSALLEGGANIRHSASESNLHRTASGTALELAEANGQREAAAMLRNASDLEFQRSGLFRD